MITLIPKSGKSKDKIENWRPISLLNTTQKILSAVIANRLRKVMDKLISINQKGFMKNRYIGECIRTVYDTMWDAKHAGLDKKGLIIFADFKRAFDTLNHVFIIETLELFNFGPELIRWIKIMLTGANSCITQNKTSTDFFPISQGCRQGDCISPLLFILCVEVLGIMIRNNASISGYRIGDVEKKVEQYADDCTFILDGSYSSYTSCVETVSEFSLISGMFLNMQKTQLLWLGSSQAPAFVTDSTFDIIKEKFKYLGIIFTSNMLDMSSSNFEAKMIDIRNLLKGWLRRKLTVYGKRTVLKTLALSKLTNILTVLPGPSEDQIVKLQRQFFKFVWDNGQDKIKRTHMIKKFGIPCIRTFNDSMKLSWIKRIICSDKNYEYVMRNVIPNSKLLFTCGDLGEKKMESVRINPFWQEVIKAWNKFQKTFPVLAESIHSQPFCLSSFFKRGGEAIWFKRLIDSGCTYVGDFWSSAGQSLSYAEFKQSYRSGISMIEHMGILRAIKKAFTGQVPYRMVGPKMQPALEALLTPLTGCRHFYKQLIRFYYRPEDLSLKSEQKWNRDLETDFQWDELYRRFVSCTKDTSLLWFQDKIMHRILTTNTFAAKFKECSPLCTFCDAERETLIHLFVTCHKVSGIWEKLENLMRNKLGFRIRIDKVTIIMGIGSDPEIAEDVQIATQKILLIVKRYIYRTKVAKESPTFEALREFIRRYGLVEINKSSGQENRKSRIQLEAHKKIYDCLLSAV